MDSGESMCHEKEFSAEMFQPGEIQDYKFTQNNAIWTFLIRSRYDLADCIGIKPKSRSFDSYQGIISFGTMPNLCD